MKAYPIDFKIQSPDKIAPVFKRNLSHAFKACGLPEPASQLYHDLNLSFSEAVANAIVHAGEIKKKGFVEARIELTKQTLKIHVYDHGDGFDLKKVQPPRFDSFEERGRGIFLMRQLMDQVDYKSKGKRKALTLTRHILSDQSQEMDLLLEMSHLLVQGAKPESIYDLFLRQVIETFQVERASILIFNEAQGCLKVAASLGLKPDISEKIKLKPGEGISGFVFQHAKACLIENIASNTSGWEKKKGYKSVSFMSAPLIIKPHGPSEKKIGVLNLTDRKNKKPFNKKDLKLLTVLANQMAFLIHTWGLWKKGKDLELVRHELDLARQIQETFLPEIFPPLVGFEGAALLEMAQGLGGDYYDFIPKDKHTLYCVVADVSGHGLSAALTVANLRSRLQGLLLQESDPGRLLTQLNRELFADLIKGDQFISVCLVKINSKNRKIYCANGGHPPPFLVREGQVKAWESASSTVLGALPDEVYHSSVSPLNKDDRIVMVTDGLLEAQSKSGERYGLKRLITLLKKRNYPPQLLIGKIKSDLNRFVNQTPLQDDVTCVVIKSSK